MLVWKTVPGCLLLLALSALPHEPCLADPERPNILLIFFISDNGGPTAECTSSNDPLRGGKGTMYEGGIRIPFLVQWKERLPGGTIFEPPVISLDVFPTVSVAAGIEMAKDRGMDGVDLLPHLTGHKNDRPHETLYWRMGPIAALRHHDWKLVLHQPHDSVKRRIELFDLAADIGESIDLAGQQPETAKELLEIWERWDRDMAAPVWTSSR